MKAECIDCGEIYPLTNKYWYSSPTTKSGFLTRCKSCTIANVEKYRKSQNKTDYVNTDKGENLALQYLKAHGIFADYGKFSRHKYVDIVAWGCVKIEVKRSINYVAYDDNPENGVTGEWSFKMYSVMNDKTPRPDVIILICERFQDGNEYHTFHILDIDNPALYKADGEMKVNLWVTEKSHKTVWMFDELEDANWLDTSLDDIAVIEKHRLRVQESLKIEPISITVPRI